MKRAAGGRGWGVVSRFFGTKLIHHYLFIERTNNKQANTKRLMGRLRMVHNELVPSTCGPDINADLVNTHTESRTFDPGLGQVELIWLAFDSQQNPTCRGQRGIDLRLNMEARRVWGSPVEISGGLLSNRTLTEVSTFKAVTCPSHIPADTLCCHEYRHEYSTLAFLPFLTVSGEGRFHRLFPSADLKSCHMLSNVTPQCSSPLENLVV